MAATPSLACASGWCGMLKWRCPTNQLKVKTQISQQAADSHEKREKTQEGEG